MLNSFILFIAAFLSLNSLPTHAQTIPDDEKLSNLEHFVRCYSKLTLMAPRLNDPRYLAVKNGTLNAADACMDLLKTATMTGTTGNLEIPENVLSGTDGSTATEIVRNFHNFHRSWFPQKFYDGSTYDSSAALIRDAEEPSLYLTRALFGQVGTNKIKYSSALTHNQSVMGLRERTVQPENTSWDSRSFFSYPATVANDEPSNMTFNFFNLPVGTLNNPSSPHHTIALPIPDGQLMQFGDLYGIKDAPPLMTPKVRSVLSGNGAPRGVASDINNVEILNYMNTTNFQSRNLREHFGGGIIGSQVFFLANSNLISYQAAYKERMINRRFTSRIQEILMCHTLPNLLPGDVQAEINPKSEYTFQQSKTCMQCHSAIDPMAGAFKNLMSYTTSNITVSRDQLKIGLPPYGVARFPTNTSAQDYVFSTPTGRLYYRDFKNNLVSQTISSPADLGAKVSGSLDYYACASKRYYYFLTGIDVTLTPVEGETSLTTYHRDQIFSYATRLKTHQNLMTLVEDIIKSDTFRTRNYKSEEEGE